MHNILSQLRNETFSSSLRLKPGDCCHEGVAVVYQDHLNCVHLILVLLTPLNY